MLKFLLAISPILWLVVAMSGLKMSGWKACGLAVLVTAAVSRAYWGLTGWQLLTASAEGALNALWPICAVIIAALFVYNLTLETGAMERIKTMLISVSPDRRVLALLIGWGFGNFMEGMAGFGTAVAIPAGVLVAMGFDAVPIVAACLLVNSTPTAFGSVGVPTQTLALVAGVDPVVLAANIARIQVLLTVLSPFFMVVIVGGGVRALRGVWLVTAVAALSFALPQCLTAAAIGPELPNIVGSILSMLCIAVVAMQQQKRQAPDPQYALPAQIPAGAAGADATLPHAAQPVEGTAPTQPPAEAGGMTMGQALLAWSPFVLIFLILFCTSSLLPVLHDPLAAVKTTATIYAGPNAGKLTFYWLDCPGVKILLAGVLGGLLQGASLRTILRVFGKTLYSNRFTIFTICSVLAVAKLMGYSGMTACLAEVLVAVTGSAYPLIAPLIGMIGGFVTGSGTSTSVLFGGLQADAATAVGASKTWLAAGNMLGGGIGKAISPQGIAIGAAAAGLLGRESEILRKVSPYAFLFVVIGGLLCLAGA